MRLVFTASARHYMCQVKGAHLFLCALVVSRGLLVPRSLAILLLLLFLLLALGRVGGGAVGGFSRRTSRLGVILGHLQMTNQEITPKG